jgi:hypothetical protein
MDDHKFINEILTEIEPQNTFYIDIGAGGRTNIPQEFLNSADLAIFCDGPGRPPPHARNAQILSFAKPWTQENITSKTVFVAEYITPLNVKELFNNITTRRDPRMVDIDVDGYDFFILESLLEEYTPSIIMIEINEKIPPPISFSVKYSPTYQHDGTHFFGTSLTKVYDFLKDRYDLVHVAWNNAYFVLKEKNVKMTTGLPYHAYTDVEAYDTFYRNRNWEESLAHNRNMAPMLTLPTPEACKFLRDFFEQANNSGCTKPGGCPPHTRDEYELYVMADYELSGNKY